MIQVWQIGLDLAVVFLLLFFLASGWKQGVVRSLVYFLGSALAIMAAVLISQPLAEVTYNFFLKNIVLEKIGGSVEKQNTAKKNLPDFLANILIWRGISKGNINQILKKPNFKENIELLISPILIGILKLILSLIIFCVVMFFVKRIARMTNSFFKFPVLSQVNSSLGAAFGLCKGAVIIWALIMIMKIAISYSQSQNTVILEKAINSSYIFEKFYNFNPLSVKFIKQDLAIFRILHTNMIYKHGHFKV
jgi:uncharacterized membrane protein required for colicin V production